LTETPGLSVGRVYRLRNPRLIVVVEPPLDDEMKAEIRKEFGNLPVIAEWTNDEGMSEPALVLRVEVVDLSGIKCDCFDFIPEVGDDHLIAHITRAVFTGDNVLATFDFEMVKTYFDDTADFEKLPLWSCQKATPLDLLETLTETEG